jgi:hypothetical protein
VDKCRLLKNIIEKQPNPHMKTRNTAWYIPFFAVLLALSCDNDPMDDEGTFGKITAQFIKSAEEIAEDGTETVVTVKLNKPVDRDEVLTLKVGDLFTQNLNSNPVAVDGIISVTIHKGQTAGQVKLTPIDNAEKDGHRIVDLKLHNLSSAFILGTINTVRVTINDDESEPVTESVANFISQDVTLEETNTTGVQYQVHFSKPVGVDSEVRIMLTSDKGVYNSDYTTQPAAENNTIILPVAAGTSVVAFLIRPLNNNYITGELSIDLAISETTGSIRKGENLQQQLKIKDDELAGKPRGYEVTAGTSVVKKFFEYDALGRVARVNWQNYTPYLTQGTDTYYYDDNGQLVRINKSPGREVLYRWENGRIVKSEDIRDGIMLAYTEFDYDEHDRVAGAVSYYPEGNGTFSKGMYTVYLYFTDGNLYKSLTYQDNADPEGDPYLVSTKTYDNYLDVANPFDISEVLPTVRTQQKLASVYRLEESGSGVDLAYNLTYEFREDGRPTKRIATAPGDVQTAVYHYY